MTKHTSNTIASFFHVIIAIVLLIGMLSSCTVHKTTIDLTAGTGSTILLDYKYNPTKTTGQAKIKYYNNTAPTDSMRKSGYIPRR